MSLFPFNPFVGQKMQSNAGANSMPDMAFLAHLNLGSPAAASQTNVLAATTLANGSTTVVTTGITNPDVPRAVQLKGNQASVTGNVVVVGTDFGGNAITDTIASNGTNAVAGTKAFKTITQITLPARGAAGDTISLGSIEVLGLPYKLAENTVLATYLAHTKEGTAPTVAVSASALESNTIDLNSALNGTQVDVYLIV